MNTENQEHHRHHPHGHHPAHEHSHVVEIFIDNKSYKIKSGAQPVAELKALGQVPLAFELAEVRDGKLIPLPDDGVVNIKGCEKFVSHPKASAAS